MTEAQLELEPDDHLAVISEVQQSITWKKRKYGLLVGMIAVQALFAILMTHTVDGSSADKWLGFGAVLVIANLCILWCICDRAEHDFQTGKGVWLTVLIIPIVGLPLYFLETRGRLGLRCILVTAIFGLGLLAEGYLVEQLVVLYNGISGY